MLLSDCYNMVNMEEDTQVLAGAGDVPATQQEVNNGTRVLNLSGHVGFDSLPDQLVNKATSQVQFENLLYILLLFVIYL